VIAQALAFRNFLRSMSLLLPSVCRTTLRLSRPSRRFSSGALDKVVHKHEAIPRFSGPARKLSSGAGDKVSQKSGLDFNINLRSNWKVALYGLGFASFGLAGLYQTVFGSWAEHRREERRERRRESLEEGKDGILRTLQTGKDRSTSAAGAVAGIANDAKDGAEERLQKSKEKLQSSAARIWGNAKDVKDGTAEEISQQS